MCLGDDSAGGGSVLQDGLILLSQAALLQVPG